MHEQNTLRSGVFGLRFSEVIGSAFEWGICSLFPDVSSAIYDAFIFGFCWFSFYKWTLIFPKIDFGNGANKRRFYDSRLYLQTLLTPCFIQKRALIYLFCSIYHSSFLFVSFEFLSILLAHAGSNDPAFDGASGFRVLILN